MGSKQRAALPGTGSFLRRAGRAGLCLGKLPAAILRSLLRHRGVPDPSVVVGPAFGFDAAVVDAGANRLVVLKSDPVTFTTLELGWYAVHVNANDVAVLGGRPRWFQPTIIVPPGTPAAAVRRIGLDIDRAARQLGIAVTGGHTEVSDAVRRPIVAGDMQGLVQRGRLIMPGGARPGDVVVMTKTAGIEGTAILARERAREARRVLGPEGQQRAARFHRRPGISIVCDAVTATRHGAHALHDPTEGGVSTALYEMASAAGCRFVVDLDAIAVHPLTRRLCDYFALRPLGLIGSGALLVALPPRRLQALLTAFAEQGIAAAVIGSVARGKGVVARAGGRRVPFCWSERDELARLDSR